HATRALGVKVVNPGGISAFKFNQRSLDVDEHHTHYGITPRDVLHVLSRALTDLGVPHPLHIHASNLGVPGNIDSTLATIDALE
ncbi:formylmethanofuran dehydrogenase subunit A, partial [Paraburkholderia sp. SIMBA_053]